MFLTPLALAVVPAALSEEQTGTADGTNRNAAASESSARPVETGAPLKSELMVKTIRLKAGDTLIEILASAGVPYAEINRIVSVAARKINLRKLQAGEAMRLYTSIPFTDDGQIGLVGLVIGSKSGKTWSISRDFRGRFIPQKLPLEQAIAKVKSAYLMYSSNTNGDGVRNIILEKGDTLSSILFGLGVSPATTTQVSQILDAEINLRKLRAGQHIQVIFKNPSGGKRNLYLASVSIQIDKKHSVAANRDRNTDPFYIQLNETNGTQKDNPPVIASDSPLKETAKSLSKIMDKDSTTQLARGSSTDTDHQKYQTDSVFSREIVRLQKGDVLFQRIVTLGASPASTQLAVRALAKFINLRRLHVGQEIRVLFYAQENGDQTLAGLIVPRPGQTPITVGRQASGGFAEGPPNAFQKNDSVSDIAATTVPLSTPTQSLKDNRSEPNPKTTSISKQLASIPTTVHMELFSVNGGDTLSHLLNRAGAPVKEAKRAMQSMRNIYNPDLIRAGQELVVELDVDGESRRLIGFVLGINKNTAAIVEFSDGRFKARKGAGKALSQAITLTDKLAAARSALATGTYSENSLAMYGFDTAESDLVDLKDAETIQFVLRPGDTLLETMINAGTSLEDADAAILSAKRIVNPRKLKAGQGITLAFVETNEAGGNEVAPKLAEVAIDLSAEQWLRIARLKRGKFVSGLVHRPLKKEFRKANGSITHSLYQAAASSEMPTDILIKLIRVFSYDVDFQRDIRKGDEFEAFYEIYVDEKGNTVSNNTLLYASMTLSGTKLGLFRFAPSDGATDYFDVQGQSVKKALMRTPIDGARLTSRYGNRRHPTLGYTKMHRGVDFGAPRGTPIFAAGDGKVERIGRYGAYGKYIRLRHGPKYQTAYAHLDSYAGRLGRGKRVKQGQVIGYVGSTGRSTGPHLHYEVLVNGKQVNPLGVKLPTGHFLTGTQLDEFLERRDELIRLQSSLSAPGAVADTQN